MEIQQAVGVMMEVEVEVEEVWDEEVEVMIEEEETEKEIETVGVIAVIDQAVEVIEVEDMVVDVHIVDLIETSHLAVKEREVIYAIIATNQVILQGIVRIKAYEETVKECMMKGDVSNVVKKDILPTNVQEVATEDQSQNLDQDLQKGAKVEVVAGKVQDHDLDEL